MIENSAIEERYAIYNIIGNRAEAAKNNGESSVSSEVEMRELGTFIFFLSRESRSSVAGIFHRGAHRTTKEGRRKQQRRSSGTG